MAAPGSMYGEGAQLLEGAAQTQGKTQELQQEKTNMLVKSGDQASANLAGERQQISGQQAAMALEKMKASEEQMTITPQIALGLAKNTGDKEWMKAIGTKLRSDVLLGLYTHGMTLAAQKRSPKISQIYDQSGKIRHAVVYTDEDGNMQSLMLDQGITPKTLNEGKHAPGRPKGGSGGSDEFKNKKEFNRAYEKRRSEYADPIKADEVKKTNPEKYDEDIQWLKDNQDTYDTNVRGMGKGGGAEGAPEPTAGGGAPQAPFDADSFIKDALGK